VNGNILTGSRPVHSSQFTARPAVGVFGGTFDPIHYGHLRLAEELGEALNLAEVRIIPAGQPPHRGVPRTPAAHRLEMTRLAVAGNPRFRLDDREVQLARASYTFDTLTDLRAELGPQRPIWLLMGADAFLGLPTWKEWKRLFDLAHIAVAHRPGYRLEQSDALNDGLRQELERRQLAGPPDAPAGCVLLKPITPLDIAATDIRSRLQEGRSVRYLVPDSVLDYIQENHLYLTT
jgi:nicotinate-nucleotide adenylyltransferase